MFNQLTNFSYQRNWKEAIGFYLAYLILIIIVGAVLGPIAGMLFGAPGSSFALDFEFGIKVGTTVAIIGSVALSFIILAKKNLMNNFGFIILAVTSGLLAFFGGGLLGLIPAAYFTTKTSAPRRAA